jgi:predicted transcriptional regulator
MGRTKAAYILGKKITVRLPEAAVEKLDVLASQLNKSSKYRIEGPWDRSKAIRWAIVRAIKAFEGEPSKNN